MKYSKHGNQFHLPTNGAITGIIAGFLSVALLA